MKKNSLVWALSWAAVSSLAIMQGCGGDDDDDGGDGSTGGKGGSSGSGATGGSSGSSGKGGTGGSSGSSGKGGTGGSTGGTGTSGSGGAPGGVGGEGGGEGGAGTTMTRAQVCTDYCQVYKDKNCLTATANTYTDEPNCRDVCNAADWPLGDADDASGDTVYCRLWHAGLASSPGPDETHCGHASEDPTGVCI